jgi:arylsulfatase A-like enzyme/Tfp pilus assembly protein PilF
LLRFRASSYTGSVRYRCAVLISLATLLCTGACAGGDGGGAGAEGPNLLLITIDTLRADRLGAYGHAGIETPAIDRLAAEGVRFARTVTPAPTTLPSHASILTGATPPRHGVRDNAAGLLPPAAHTLAEGFRERGFRTGAFVSAFVLDARWGLAQGFDVYDGPPVAPGESPASPAQAERRGDATLDAALRFMESETDAPWFVWLHLFDPHAPYRAPEPFGSRYASAPYDGEIAWTDSLIGQLRARLEELGEWADTTVILTADHGEALMEHGEPAHGFFLYEPTLRVPLIVRLAGADVPGGDMPATGADADQGGASIASPGGSGRVVETPVGLIDIYPTVAELWELDPGPDSQGRSLAPALRGDSIETVPIYSETLLPRLYFGWAELKAITDGDEKYVEAPREELYDTRQDPGEIANLAADRPGSADRLHEELIDWIERSEAGAIGAPDEAVADDPDRLAALRSLGYLGVGGGDASADLADPKDKIEVYAAMMVALGAWELGDTDQALAIIDEQIAADPEFAGAWHFRGLVLAGSGRYEEATEAFEAALEVDPGHALAGRELAHAYRAQEDFVGSAAAFREQLASSPDDLGLRWELADVLLRAGRWDEVRAVLQEGLALAPDDPRMHFGAGVVALQEGAPREALASFDRAAAAAPDLPSLHYHRGDALERLGRPDEALAAYEAEISRQPRHYFSRFNRARLLAVHGAPLDEVIAALREALAVRPEAPEAALFLAQSLADRGDAGDLAEAERWATAGLAAAEVPQLQAMGHATLAQVYEAQGRSEEAASERAAAQRLSGGR